MSGFKNADGTLEPKDLFNSCPLLAKPVVQVRAAQEVALLQPSMRFVPGLGLLPASSVWGRVSEEISNIRTQRGLVVFGKQEVGSAQPINLGTERPLSCASHPR